MIVTQKMSTEAETAAVRYGALIDSWRHLFVQALTLPNFGSMRVINSLQAQAYAMSRTYLETERTLIDHSFAQIASDARTATEQELSVTTTQEDENAVSDHLSEIAAHLLSELTIQIERDVAHLVEAIRRAWFQVRVVARSQRISLRQAQSLQNIGTSSPLQFFFQDRGNNKWPSRKFVRSVWRQHLLAAYNETVLYILADHGFDVAEVLTASPGNNDNGMKVALSANTDLPTYEEIRNQVFHPNADAILHKASE